MNTAAITTAEIKTAYAYFVREGDSETAHNLLQAHRYEWEDAEAKATIVRIMSRYRRLTA